MDKPKVEGKLSFGSEWGALGITSNSLLIALILLDKFPTYTQLTVKDAIYPWAKDNIDYMLGNNSHNYSFQAGFTDNFPKHPHHITAYCPDPPAECTWEGWESNEENHHVLEGALVGGPDINGQIFDTREDYVHNEPTCDSNSGFTGVLAYLFNREQTVADILTVNRTCVDGPGSYIGASADNIVLFEKWLKNKAKSPFPGCKSTKNLGLIKLAPAISSRLLSNRTANSTQPRNLSTEASTLPLAECQDTLETCQYELTQWDICKNKRYRNKCKKTCCVCGCTEGYNVCRDHSPRCA